MGINLEREKNTLERRSQTFGVLRSRPLKVLEKCRGPKRAGLGRTRTKEMKWMVSVAVPH